MPPLPATISENYKILDFEKRNQNFNPIRYSDFLQRLTADALEVEYRHTDTLGQINVCPTRNN